MIKYGGSWVYGEIGLSWVMVLPVIGCMKGTRCLGIGSRVEGMECA